MEHRFGAILALVGFAMCVAIGALEANNAFAETIGRSLAAMAGCYVVGYLVGLAAERMLRERRESDENLKKNLGKIDASTTDGR